MVETLLSPSNVLLYGRVMEDITLVEEYDYPPNTPAPPTPEPQPEPHAQAQPEEPTRPGHNNFLQRQLDDPQQQPRLARIYGFSFEGHYYDLAKPAIFLVHGGGHDPEAIRPGRQRYSRAPADADRTGVASQAGSYSDDIRVWSYDKNDFSIRLDTETGTFEEILLEAEMRTDKLSGTYSGMDARIRTSASAS